MHHGYVTMQGAVLRWYWSIQQHQFSRANKTSSIHFQRGYPAHKSDCWSPQASQSPAQGMLAHQLSLDIGNSFASLYRFSCHTIDIKCGAIPINALFEGWIVKEHLIFTLSKNNWSQMMCHVSWLWQLSGPWWTYRASSSWQIMGLCHIDEPHTHVQNVNKR